MFLVPPIIILTYTFFLRRFANPTKLEELLKLKEEREIERAREKEEKDKEREIEKARERERKDREEKEEQKRIKDNYLDIGLGHKLPKTIEKIRNPITDKSVIKIDTTYIFGDDTKGDFCKIYTVKYMPTLLHEIRKELIDEMIENEMKYVQWKEFIKKKYDPILIKGEIKDKSLEKLHTTFGSRTELRLLIEIISEKLIEYFLENGWTLSDDQFEQEELSLLPIPMKTIVNKQVFYLHPPEK